MENAVLALLIMSSVYDANGHPRKARVWAITGLIVAVLNVL